MWGSQLEQRFISELKVHVQKKFNLTHGLEDLSVDFILHEDKVLDSDVVGVQVHRPKKRAPWAALLLLANAIDCFSALHHEEGRRGKLVSRKKSVCSWFVAESTPLNGELAFMKLSLS